MSIERTHAAPPAAGENDTAHALLGTRADAPVAAWGRRLSAHRAPFLPDHRVQGLMVLPGSAYAELGLSIHHELSGEPHAMLQDIEFHKALVIEDGQEPLLQATYDEKSREYAVYTQRPRDKKWELHARGRLSFAALPPAARLTSRQSSRGAHNRSTAKATTATCSVAGSSTDRIFNACAGCG